MTSFKLLGATALLSALIATPTFAQPVIDEPGSYAFFYPNGDLGFGPAPSTADALALAPVRSNGVMMKMKMSPRPARMRR
jgi:hypothetical protein